MHTTLEWARSNATKRHDPSTRNLLASIPYFPSNASSMKKSLARFDISIFFHSSANLKCLLSHTKSACPPSSLKNVVYKIPCIDCLDYYIGQTCRPLIKRIKEHEACMRLDNHTDNSTGIKSIPAKHGRDNDHRIDWKSTTILATCENKSQLNLMEHAAIKTLVLAMNIHTKARQSIPVEIPFFRRSSTAFDIFLPTLNLRPSSVYLCDLIFSCNICL